METQSICPPHHLQKKMKKHACALPNMDIKYLPLEIIQSTLFPEWYSVFLEKKRFFSLINDVVYRSLSCRRLYNKTNHFLKNLLNDFFALPPASVSPLQLLYFYPFLIFSFIFSSSPYYFPSSSFFFKSLLDISIYTVNKSVLTAFFFLSLPDISI